jgi:hypothetical protein
VKQKRPAFQFYPGDWRRDAALRSCSLEARGLWVDLLCLMHDGEPYGHLAVNGKPLTDAQVAAMVGVSVARYRKLLQELEVSGVSSRGDDGALFSRRMVRDEYLREVRATSGKLGGNPALLVKPVDNQPPKQTANQNPTPAVAVASASASTTTTTPPPAGDGAAEIAREHAKLLARFPGPGLQRIAVTEFLLNLPERESPVTWAGVLLGCLDGLGMSGGRPAPPDAVAVACLDYATTDAGKQGKYDPRYFRACVESAAKAGRKPMPVRADQRATDSVPTLKRLA